MRALVALAACFCLASCAPAQGTPSAPTYTYETDPYPITLEPTTEVTSPAPTDPTPSEVYYGSCADVRAAGATSIRRGQPGYRAELDRDDDGVACETEN